MKSTAVRSTGGQAWPHMVQESSSGQPYRSFGAPKLSVPSERGLPGSNGPALREGTRSHIVLKITNLDSKNSQFGIFGTNYGRHSAADPNSSKSATTI